MASAAGQFGPSILAIVLAAPFVAAILAFLPNPTLRGIGRFILFLAWLACAAAVIGCLWMLTRPSSGIGNGVFLIVAVIPAVAGLIVFSLWSAARRFDHLRSLPPAQREVEELADLEESIRVISRDLQKQEERARGWFLSSREKQRLQTDIALMRMTLSHLLAQRAKRTSG